MTCLDRRAERAKVSLDDSRRLESKGVACSLARQSQIDPRPLAKVAGRSQGRPFMFWFYWDTAWSVIISGSCSLLSSRIQTPRSERPGDRELVLPRRAAMANGPRCR